MTSGLDKSLKRKNDKWLKDVKSLMLDTDKLKNCGSDDPKFKLQKGDGEAVCGQFQKSIVIITRILHWPKLTGLLHSTKKEADKCNAATEICESAREIESSSIVSQREEGYFFGAWKGE
ncbi:hypothetical protein HID58_015478 [Brassica napus]|uniref:BnaA04g14240D protein n=2 Tax=Brassica napus TaxID=3708 RepID=A0A078I8G4_BRANA|nr:uncharacterized protein LOC125608199 [Brassica napus]KAH0929751.1 hypothetical protein HID58_015478 [Brassica napus]CAF2279040.1 unnamed protein product [Brassica napus]CDY46136.1 BnaA04g14240D [Brassica napus]